MAVMRGLVANGFGYSIVNIRPVNDIAPDGKAIRFIPLTGAPRPMKMGLLMGGGMEQTLLHKAFLDHTRAWIETHADAILGTRKS